MIIGKHTVPTFPVTGNGSPVTPTGVNTLGPGDAPYVDPNPITFGATSSGTAGPGFALPVGLSSIGILPLALMALGVYGVIEHRKGFIVAGVIGVLIPLTGAFRFSDT